MSNNKQSSVEWLIKQLNQKIDYIPMRQWDEITEIIAEAKAMHKEEIIKAWVGGKGCLNGEHYYNETFGGNNEQQ